MASKKKNIRPGKTTKGGRTERLRRRYTSKYDDIRAAVLKLRYGQEHIVDVPAGVPSERFRNNLYHALRNCRTKGYLWFARTPDCKKVIIGYERE